MKQAINYRQNKNVSLGFNEPPGKQISACHRRAEGQKKGKQNYPPREARETTYGFLKDERRNKINQ